MTPTPQKLRCVYCDLDGTLLGRDGSLLHDGDGVFATIGVRALEACSRAGVEFVIFTGRRKISVAAAARLLGQTAFIYEAGCGLVVDGEDELFTGELIPDEELTVHELIERSGAPKLLLERYPGELEYHSPWHSPREFSHLFRGAVDIEEANGLLHEHGHGHLRLLDNGRIHRKSPTLVVEQARCYHLMPRPASKAVAVARHMQIRGYGPGECIAIGDSREDLGAAAVVGTFWLVGNALARDPGLSEVVSRTSNVRVAEGEYGAGAYEAIMTMLAE